MSVGSVGCVVLPNQGWLRTKPPAPGYAQQINVQCTLYKAHWTLCLDIHNAKGGLHKALCNCTIHFVPGYTQHVDCWCMAPLSEMIMHHILIQSKTIQMRVCPDHSSLLRPPHVRDDESNMHFLEKHTNLIKRHPSKNWSHSTSSSDDPLFQVYLVPFELKVHCTQRTAHNHDLNVTMQINPIYKYKIKNPSTTNTKSRSDPQIQNQDPIYYKYKIQSKI